MDERESKEEFLWRVLGRYDHYIQTANTKAAFVVSVSAFILSALVFGVANASEPPGVIVALSLISIVLVVLGVLEAIASILPDVSTPKQKTSDIFFGDVASQEGIKDYAERISDMDDGTRMDDLISQVYAVAGITSRKFRLVTSSMKWLRAGLLTGSLASVFYIAHLAQQL